MAPGQTPGLHKIQACNGREHGGAGITSGGRGLQWFPAPGDAPESLPRALARERSTLHRAGGCLPPSTAPKRAPAEPGSIESFVVIRGLGLIYTRLSSRSLFAAMVLACGVLAHAQDAPTFAIRGYQIEGNSLLPQPTVSNTVMPFTGPKASFETIQLALEALEKAYLQAGFGSVRIEVPEQDLQDGVVRLLVVEARLERVVVEGAKFHDEANIRRALPALRTGEVVNVNQLQRNLHLANESFSRHLGVTFRQSEATAQTDAIVRVADDKPLRFVVSLDDTGNLTTGRYRLGLSLLHSNLFNLDHALSVQWLTSPTHVGKVAIAGVGYRIPQYALGDSVDLTLGYSNVDSGRIDLFSVSGGGRILGARYNRQLASLGEWEHKLSYAIDRRSYGNSVVPAGGGASMVPDLHVTPLSLGYSANLRTPRRGATWRLPRHPDAEHSRRAQGRHGGVQPTGRPCRRRCRVHHAQGGCEPHRAALARLVAARRCVGPVHQRSADIGRAVRCGRRRFGARLRGTRGCGGSRRAQQRRDLGAGNRCAQRHRRPALTADRIPGCCLGEVQYRPGHRRVADHFERGARAARLLGAQCQFPTGLRIRAQGRAQHGRCHHRDQPGELAAAWKRVMVLLKSWHGRPDT